MHWPRYLGMSPTDLRDRIAAADELISACRLCPRRCGARRTDGEVGACGVGAEAQVASYGPHFGEERPLVGAGGSGTIFFARCNLSCVFCQNADISQLGDGLRVSARQLASIMLDLQERGCENINVVTPTHQMPQILHALAMAQEHGLHLPIVYNCGGYESVEALRILDGIVDIYMPDLKFADDAAGFRYSGVENYFAAAHLAIREMHRQVGDLEVNSRGVARQGLLVRHLVLPHGLAGTPKAVAFLAELSPHTYMNAMAQYRPCYRASEYSELSRRPTAAEFAEAVAIAREAGLRLDG
ncbi:MAG TPA: radical SAM protein [Candidatus Baltobacteraceae bacterium]|nr:radical SAM protein [Candidatus Baltobacteraceae bacterium]